MGHVAKTVLTWDGQSFEINGKIGFRASGCRLNSVGSLFFCQSLKDSRIWPVFFMSPFAERAGSR